MDTRQPSSHDAESDATDCPGIATLIRVADDNLVAGERARLHAHLERCAACEAAASAYLRAQRTEDASSRRFEARFSDREVIGRGGMGTVFRAYDRTLGRTVALKLINANLPPELETRLVDEARAMARVVHDNVLGVYDVGHGPAGPFIVMPLVQGTDLKTWLVAASRGPREIVAMFVRAGIGLAAAHRAGLVHRDFKPANVLVARDGTPKVADFGLALSPADHSRTPPVGSSAGTDSLEFAGEGTPRYMSPEQRGGMAPDARSDQFSFAVALWEALSGAPPAVCVRGRGTRSRGRGIPLRLRRPLRRALSADRSHRFETMDALLAELRRAPRRRRVAGVALALGGTAALAGANAATERNPVAEICLESARVAASAWSISSRTAARDAHRGWRDGVGRLQWSRLEATLGGWVERWWENHDAVCGAARPNPVAARCLHDEAMNFRRSVVALSDDPDAALPRGYALAENVTAPRDRACAGSTAHDRAATTSFVPPPVYDAEHSLSLRKFELALRQAWPDGGEPSSASAAFVAGKALIGLQRYDEAGAALERAFFGAQADGDLWLASSVAAELARFYAGPTRDHARGRQWGARALALIGATGDDPAKAAGVRLLMASLELSEGRLRAATSQLDTAAAGFEGGVPREVAVVLAGRRAEILLAQDRPREAAVAFQQATPGAPGVPAAEHHVLRQVRHGLFNALAASGQSMRVEALRGELEGWTRDPEHGWVFALLLGAHELQLGRVQTALSRFREAEATVAARPSAPPAFLAFVRLRIARALVVQQSTVAARELLTELLAEDSDSPVRDRAVNCLLGLADLDLAAGDYGGARARLDQADQRLEDISSPATPTLRAWVAFGRTKLALQTGDLAAAHQSLGSDAVDNGAIARRAGESFTALWLSAELAAHEGRWTEARRYLQQAVAGILSRGGSPFLLGRCRRAIDRLERAAAAGSRGGTLGLLQDPAL